MSERPAWITSLAAAAERIDRAERLPFRFAFEHGTLQAGVYLPGERDNQRPHNRDEAYIVMTGEGEVVVARERAAFAPGDFIFVPANAEHRFENYTAELALWVIFYGPEGGERPGKPD